VPVELVAAVHAALPVHAQARAQTSAYPERPIRLIVAIAAGGPTDTAACALAEGLASALGRTW
jgi:tripartite-type tricarboxylate transporter receptor subunit TctC